MFALERQKIILEQLKENGAVLVSKLSVELGVTEETVRRDLEKLEAKELLLRTHGGAIPLENTKMELSLEKRKNTNTEIKEQLAAEAAKFIVPGDTIFLDASTTTFYLAPFLRSIPDLTVITNNPHLNLALAKCHVRNFSTGGEMLNDSAALVGSTAERYIMGIQANAVFFSARGVCDGVVTDSSKGERDIKIAMLENSKRSYFLCDESKNGKEYPYIVTRTEKLTGVIGL